jgi:outer membrane protein OmpA-like peptidoglycan-associated protein
MKKTLLILLPAFALASCAQQQLAKADKDHARMAYAKAAEGYEKVLPKITDRDAALRAADAYQRMNMNAKAADWYAFASRLQPLGTDDALRYAQVLQSLDRTPQALQQFDRVLAQRPEDAMVQALRNAAAEKNTFYIDTTLFSVVPVELPGMVSVFAATKYGNGIVFAGETEAPLEKRNPWTGNSFLDLYSASPSANGSWGTPKALPGAVNGRFHDGPATFSADERTMYFTRSDYYKFRLNKDGSAVSHLMLYRATKDDQGNWTDIHQFAYNGDEFSTGHAALSADGGTLYYISDMPGGFGGTDIYRCLRTEDGWSEPVNLGATVNTAGNEMFPTLFGDSLFFSSNGHRSLGGLDIFVTTSTNDGWSTPENLNYPINTVHDDLALVMLPDGTHGFLSSNRSGSDRIHSFTTHEPTLIVEGTFKDDEHYLPMAEVEVKLLDISSGEDLKLMTGPDGKYSFNLSKDREYRLSGEKNGMFTESRDLSTADQKISRTWTEDFELKEVIVDKPILVENIYYDYDRWDLRAEAAVELDKLARIFMDNPSLSFELSSHTDSRASHVYNLMLSEARAKSAVDYLIRKGVDPSRITAKGYGESKLVNGCRDGVECTEDEHQANRRTEFKVTKVSSVTP